jgi:hypothetical protein
MIRIGLGRVILEPWGRREVGFSGGLHIILNEKSVPRIQFQVLIQPIFFNPNSKDLPLTLV